MNPELLCRWLGLPDSRWPPDARTLLGLAPEDRDPTTIEQRVHDRMAKLRCYQISNPEEATEGMNRLAQAYVSLMEDSAPTAPAPACALEEPVVFTPVEPAPEAAESAAPKKADWQSAPPPVRRSGVLPPIRPVATADAAPVPVAAPAGAPPRPRTEVDPLVQLTHESAQCKSGLRTLEAIVERVDHTRRLLVSWNRVGKLLRDSKGRSSRPIDEHQLLPWLHEINEEIEDFPKILGRPGMPGYRVVAMAKLEMSPAMFRALDPVQRELLAVDWVNGQRVLLLYRKYLHQLFRKMRHRGPVALTLHALRSLVHDHPGWILTSLALIALVIVRLAWM